MSRAFVIGNGPSLAATPMWRLRGEFTIACNRFDLLRAGWDPNYWIMADVHHSDMWWNWDDLLSRKSTFVFREQDRSVIEPLGRPNVAFVPRCEHIGGDHVPTAWHLPTACEYGGSISYAIQLAALMGRSPIYLVGADLYVYRGPDEPDINHFHPSYCPYKIRKSTGEEMIGPADWAHLNDRLIHSHEIARDSAARMGIEIVNATVGGALETYRRVAINDALDVVE